MKEKILKKEFKIGLVFLIVGLVILSSLLVFVPGNISSGITPNSMQQKMPFTVKYGFYAGISGTPYYINNLIFILTSSQVKVFNSNFVQVATISGSGNTYNYIAKFSPSEVGIVGNIGYKDQFGNSITVYGYWIFNTTTSILSTFIPYYYPLGFMSSYNLTSISDYSYNNRHSYIYYQNYDIIPYWNNETNSTELFFLFNSTEYIDQGFHYNQWFNESYGGVEGFIVHNLATNTTEIIKFPSNIPIVHAIYEAGWSTNASSYLGLPRVATGTFIPTFVPYPYIFAISPTEFAMLGQVMTNIYFSSTGIPNIVGSNITIFPGPIYLVVFNITTKQSYAIQENVSSLLGFNLLSDYNWEYVYDDLPPEFVDLNAITSYSYSIRHSFADLFSSILTNNSMIFVYHNYLYVMEEQTIISSSVRSYFEYSNASSVSPFLSGPPPSPPPPTIKYYFISISLNSSNVYNISFPAWTSINNKTTHVSTNIIVNNTLFLESVNGSNYYLTAVDIKPNALPIIFSYPVLGGSSFSFGQNGNMLLLLSASTLDLYEFEMYPTFPVTINVLGVQNNTFWNISINPIQSGISGYYSNNLNKTIVSSTHFVVNLYPISYYLNISEPPKYVVYSITYSGKGIQMNIPSSALFSPTVSVLFNITADPTINVTFAPVMSKVTFASNLNQGSAWLSQYNLQTNVNWQVKVFHGSNPSQNVFYGYSLPPAESNVTNYTLIQNSTSQNIAFYLQNGSYQYEASTISEFIPISIQNLTVVGNTTISLNFKPNLPIVQLASKQTTIPQDSAWIFQSTSYALYGTYITSQTWTISGPVYYYGVGNQFVAYFNTSGTYTLNLTVTNNYGLKNYTSYSFEVIPFKQAAMDFHISKMVGFWTNSSATYVVNITYSYKLGAMANLQGIIDKNSYMTIRFVSFTNTSGNYTYEYFATFNPSAYYPENHTITFIAYTTSGYYNGTVFTSYFGSYSANKPFNLIDFLGGPANFIMILLGILGTIIAIAEIKISRTSDVIIETGGKESIIKAKPVKEKLSDKLLKRMNKRSLKKSIRNQGKGGKKR